MALRLNGSSSGYVELDVPADAGSHTLILPDGGGTAHQVLKNSATAGTLEYGLALPTGNGTSGQYLQTDGLGGSSWVTPAAGGKLLQSQYTEKTDVFSLSADQTWTDVTGMSLSITPSSSSNHVLVSFDWAFSGDQNYTQFRIYRGSDLIYVGDSSSDGQQSAGSYLTNTVIYVSCVRSSVFFRDSPGTTDPVTYKMQMYKDGSQNSYINRSFNTGSYTGRTASSITLMEVAG